MTRQQQRYIEGRTDEGSEMEVVMTLAMMIHGSEWYVVYPMGTKNGEAPKASPRPGTEIKIGLVEPGPDWAGLGWLDFDIHQSAS
jgi:hypothetical protein